MLGRYVLYDEIGAGGMATIHLARHVGPMGFARTVAIKRLHPQFARDPEFVAMFLDEARLTACINHPNVASMLDVVTAPDALCLVMEYLEGEDLAHLMAHHKATDDAPIAPALAVALVTDALRGLHAAHEATDTAGEPLKLVHRDVSPHNLFVGVDGTVRVLDFGIAKATARSQVTREGQVKGKIAYMSPEQIRSQPVDRRTDVFAAGIVLWELLTGKRLFARDDVGAAVHDIMGQHRRPPSELAPGVPAALDALVLRALAIHADDRFATAAEMAAALEDVIRPAKREAVGDWVRTHADDKLAEQRVRRTAIERIPSRELESEITRADHVASSLNDALGVVVGREHRAEAATAADLPMVPAVPASASAQALSSEQGAPRRRSRAWVAALVVVLAALAVALLVGAYGPSSPTTAASGEHEPAAPTTGPTRVTTFPVESTSPTEPVASTPVPEASDRPATNSKRRVVAPAIVKPNPADDCKPPFRYENGIKRYKPHCL